jgi:mono/diheme cytochrome c family protein
MLLKLAKYVLLPLVCVVGGGVLFLVLRKPAMAAARDIRVEITAERIARGKYIFENLADCQGCHSPRDIGKFGAPAMEGMTGAGWVFPDGIGMPGRIVASNLTPDPETGLGRWTDGEKIRAIREGVSRNGRALFPFMPYQKFSEMSDEDVYSVVAYMNTMRPVRNSLPKTELNFPLPLLIKGVPQPVDGVVKSPDPTNKLKYGEYLVNMAGCTGCHTRHERGEPVEGKEFAGGEAFAIAGFFTQTPNITPDEDSGIGKWDEQKFISKFRGYANMTPANAPKHTQANFTLMPWYGLSKLTDEDLSAIYAFLRTVKPVYNPVEVHPPVAPPQS